MAEALCAHPSRVRPRGRCPRPVGVVSAVLAAASAAVCAAAPQTTSAPTDERPAKGYVIVRDIREIMQRRVVKSFDFDERKLGNVESVPMYWERHLGKGFPHFLVGQFDAKVGHQAPPSFYLGLQGGSVGYVYRAQDIPVEVSSDYLVSIWVRPDRLKHARAYASAFYCDRNGRPQPETVRFSERLGGTDAPQEWQEVRLRLPGGNVRAQQIGIGLWVTQPSEHAPEGLRDQEIRRQDVRGGAWFDDINVIRLPCAVLATDQPGNVFTSEQEPVLYTRISDFEARDLTAALEVFAADGKRIRSQAVSVGSRGKAAAEVVRLGTLPPGLYHGRLTVQSGKLCLSTREVRFVQLAPRLNDPRRWNEGFGLVLTEDDYACAGAASRLVRLLQVKQVKLPLGPPMSNPSGQADRASEAVRLLERFWQDRIAVVGMLATATDADRRTEAAGPTASTQPSVPALLEKPEAWRAYLAGPLVQGAGLVQSWQVGRDDEEVLAWDPSLVQSLNGLRAELARWLFAVEMVVPWPLLHEAPSTALEPDTVSLYVPNRVRPSEVGSHLQDLRSLRPHGLWAVVQSLASDHYQRELCLADLAKRLIRVCAAGTETVFLPRPWDVTRRGGDAQIEPREEYVIFRTVAEVLSQARPIGAVYLGEGIHAVTFDREGSAVVAVWDEKAPDEGRPLTMYWGKEPLQVDLWGRRRPLTQVGQHHEVSVTRTPIFVQGKGAWHLKLRASFALEPPDVESSFRLHERTVRFVNPRSTPIAGMLRLKAPPGWEVRPARIPFSLAAGQALPAKVTLRFPANEVAGPKTLEGNFLVDSDETYEFTALAPFRLALDDLEVHSFARIERDAVIIHQTVTNRSKKEVDLEGYVTAPGRARLVRMYHRAKPGQTVLKKYVLDNARRLQGRLIRVGLREIHGPRVLNQVVLVQ